jgi:hypothetical protein
MTGRAAGYCTGYSSPGYMNPGGRFSGRGAFGGRGRGMMHRHWFHASGYPGWARYDMGYPAWGMEPMPYPQEMEPAEESTVLKEQADYLKTQLEDIQKRLSELEGQKKGK